MTMTRTAVAWSAVVAGILLIVLCGALLIGAINDRGARDEPLARAECAELADGAEFEFEWRLGLRPGWVCSWPSTDGAEGGGAYIGWNAYAAR